MKIETRNVVAISKLVNKIPMTAYLMMADHMDANNVVDLHSGLRRKIMWEIGSDAKDPMKAISKTLSNLSNSGLICKHFHGTYIVNPEYLLKTKELKNKIESDYAFSLKKALSRKGFTHQEWRGYIDHPDYMDDFDQPNVGYIYLVAEKSEGHTKIGRTKNIKNRLRTFNVKLPFKVELIHWHKSDEYIQEEKDLHFKYSSKRVNGEWFDLSDDDISEIKGMAQS